MWKKYVGGMALAGLLAAGASPVWTPDPAEGAGKSDCDISKTTICTIEMWLAHKQKKNNKEIRQTLKDRSVKVLRQTIQYWRPRGGHPPTNIAIGRGLNAGDARWVIDLALKYNDTVSGLVQQRLNPPNYVAIATSAWDAKSETPISPEELERLRDPALTTEQFHALYVELTGEQGLPREFY
ncbi:MAG: hypothetical protein ACE5ER_08410 [Nitrospinaceae bacterium]